MCFLTLPLVSCGPPHPATNCGLHEESRTPNSSSFLFSPPGDSKNRADNVSDYFDSFRPEPHVTTGPERATGCAIHPATPSSPPLHPPRQQKGQKS